jgi:hypothetical protein
MLSGVVEAVAVSRLAMQAHADSGGRAGTSPTEIETTQAKKQCPLLVFSGFIKHEMFFDTRQVINAREGLVSLYPENVRLDASNNDINARHSFNMLGIHSRLRAAVNGPQALRAQTQGVVEADFYGNENKNFSDLNGLRLFNTYIKFKWKSTEVMAGQYWHPMSVPEYFPGVISFSAGAPFHPMSRNPQIRIQHLVGKLKLVGVLLSQRDFTSTGPDGPGSQYLRNSGIPNAHIQAQYGSDSSVVSAGAGLDFKKIVPALFTKNEVGELFSTRKSVSSISMVGFLNFKTKVISLKTQAVYAQNSYDLLMLGGYAEKHVANSHTGEKVFSNLTTASIWVDIQSGFRKFSFGAFSGYTSNLGAARRVVEAMYTRGADIKCVFRIAPRVIYTVKNVGISLEGEHTTAYYGVENGDGRGGVTHADAVTNFRVLCSVRYSL